MKHRPSTALITALAVLALLAAACGDDDTSAESTTTSTSADQTNDETPPLMPASISADDQSSDGTTVTVATITLPAPGFIAIHSGAAGKPGPVIGHSDLLPAGESSDVVVTLDEPLTGDAAVFPMAHVDVDENGNYDFMPPDITTDSPAATDAGEVAVVRLQVTVE